jgi:hypothetical protein
MKNSKQIISGSMLIFSLLLVNAIVLRSAFTLNEKWYWLLLATIPMLVVVQMVAKRNR